ncbi:unnamed protein product [Closterium sp. NIES-54]
MRFFCTDGSSSPRGDCQEDHDEVEVEDRDRMFVSSHAVVLGLIAEGFEGIWPLGPSAPPLGPLATASATAATATAAAAPAATATPECCATMASLRVLAFDHEGRPVAFDTWHDDLQLYLLSDIKDSVSLFDHVTGVAPAPPATADGTTRSQWLSHDATARLAIRNHLPVAECTHFGQHRTAQALYDAVVARYSSPATAALGRLLLPYLFHELSAFATVADLVTHLRTSDARYRATDPAEFLATNKPAMFITLYFIVSRLPDSLCFVRDHFLSLDPTSLTVDHLEQHLLAAETRAVAVGAARGTLRPPFFEGAKRRSSKGKVGRGGGGGSGGGGGGSGSGGGGSGGGGGGSGGGGGGGTGGGSGALVAAVESAEGVAVVEAVRLVVAGVDLGMEALVVCGTGGGTETCPYVIRTGVRAGQTCGKFHTEHRCFSRLDDDWRAEFGDDAERPRWTDLLRSGVAIFDLDYDAIISAMYALSFSAEGDCYRCVPPDPGIAAAALGASASGTPLGTAPAEALHTFTLDSSASRCFFRDSTTLTPLPAPVPVRLVDPSRGPVVARSSTILPCSTVLSSSLSDLHLPSFSTNLVSTAALQDAMVTTTTPGGQRVSICTCTHMGRHLATFTRRPGSSLYTLATEPPQVAASAQVSASGHVAASCSCRLLLHQTLLWHHRLGHPSLPRLRGMHSRFLVSGLPKSLPPLPPSPAPPCLPCVEGRQRAAPHSSSFPLTTAPLQTLHMDDVTFDQPVPFYHLFPYRSAPPPPPPLFLAPGPLPVDPLPPQGPAPSGVSQVHPLPGTVPVQVAVGSSAAPGAASGGAASGGAEPGGAGSEGVGSGGAEPGGVEPRGAELEGAESGGAESEVAESRGAEPRGAASSGGPAGASPRLSSQQLREWLVRRAHRRSGAPGAGGAGDTGAGGAAVRAGASGTGGAETTGPRGAHTSGAGAAGTGGVGCAGAGDPTEPGAAGAGSAGAGGAGVGGPSAGGAGAAGVGVGGTSAEGARPPGAGAVDPGAGSAGGTLRTRQYFVPLLQQVLGVPSSTGLPPPFLCPPLDQSQPSFQPASPLPAPSPYTEQSDGLTERREPASHPVSPVRTARHGPRLRPPPVPGTHAMALRPSSVPLRVPLPAPPESSLPEVLDPPSDRARCASPTVSHLLATAVTDPSFESAAMSALVPELLDLATACRLDYASALVAESVSASPPSVEEAIMGPYSSQWQAAMDAEMSSWKSTGNYVDEVPPSRTNIVDGMWIFRVKRPPCSPPAFKARYVARGFSQRQGVDYFHTFSPTPKMTTIRVLLQVASQRDYELHSLDFSTDFLQGSLHEEIWLRRPPGFTGTFPAGTQ